MRIGIDIETNAINEKARSFAAEIFNAVGL